MHDATPPSGESNHILYRRDRCLIAIGRVHAPADVLRRGKRQERRPAVPLPGAKGPQHAEQVHGQPGVDGGTEGQSSRQPGPADLGLHHWISSLMPPITGILAAMTGASTTAHALAHYRAEFPVFERQIYLNTCSLGALSRRSRERVEAFLGEWDRRGASAWYDVWWESLAELRRGYAGVVGARAEEIARHAAVSTATGVLASALDHGA